MPAIDLARLQREVDRLAAFLEDPATLRRAVLDLLEFYADRTRRPAAAHGASASFQALFVPRPVLRALARGLQAATRGDDALSKSAAAALWDARVRETRLLAVALLSKLRGPEAGRRAGDWAEDCEDPVVLQELASIGMASWLEADPSAVYDLAALGLHSHSSPRKTFSLLLLAELAAREGFADLPALFQLLGSTAVPAEPAPRRAFRSLLQALARRSPPETAQVLLEGLSRGRAGYPAMARQLLPSLPTALRASVERALTGRERAGMMRPPND